MLKFIMQRSVMAQQADVIVGLICRDFPLAQQGRLTDVRLKKRCAHSVRRIATAARSAAHETRAGILGQAYLANRVRWELSERGYCDEFVSEITSGVVVAMQS